MEEKVNLLSVPQTRRCRNKNMRAWYAGHTGLFLDPVYLVADLKQNYALLQQD